MSEITEVFILAENRLLRETLIRLLSRTNDIHLVGASAYSPDIDREIISAHPQVVLLDSRGFSSFARQKVIFALRAAKENLRLVLVSVGLNETKVLQADRAGVVGYVSKDASALEVVSTIRAVVAGEFVESAPLADLAPTIPIAAHPS